jgi:hypothetical protein
MPESDRKIPSGQQPHQADLVLQCSATQARLFMKLVRLRYFVAVVEELSFTRAAAKLRIAQPALSRQIRILENEVGAELLVRNGRAFKLTPAGEVLSEEGATILIHTPHSGPGEEAGHMLVASRKGIYIVYASLAIFPGFTKRVKVLPLEEPDARIPGLHGLAKQ